MIYHGPMPNILNVIWANGKQKYTLPVIAFSAISQLLSLLIWLQYNWMKTAKNHTIQLNTDW